MQKRSFSSSIVRATALVEARVLDILFLFKTPPPHTHLLIYFTLREVEENDRQIS